MVAIVRTFENRGVIRDTSQPTQALDTSVTDAAHGVFDETQQITNDLLVSHDKARTKNTFNDFNERARNEYQRLTAREGSDAIGKNSVMDEYQEWFDKEQSELSDTLDNTDQQEGFKLMTDAKGSADLDRLSSHEAVENKKYQISVHEGTISDANADIMINYGSDDAAEVGELRIRESFEDVFGGVDNTKAMQKEIASYRALRITMLADNQQIDKAFKILESSKDELKGAYLPLKKSLQNTQLTEEAQIETDKIMANPNLTPEQQSKEAKKFTGEKRELIEQMVEDEQGDAERYKKQRRTQAREFDLNNAINIFQNNQPKADYMDYVRDSVNDPVVEKELISYGNALYDGNRQSFNGEVYNTLWREIDASNQEGQPLTDADITVKATPFMNDAQVQKLIDRNRKQGNVGEIKKNELDKLFKKYVGREATERPQQAAEYSDYIIEQLTPGQKPSSDDVARWSADYFKQTGTAIDAGIFRRNLKGTRDILIKNLDDENFVPTEDLLRIETIFNSNPETKQAWIAKYGTEDKAKIEYYKQAKRQARSNAN